MNTSFRVFLIVAAVMAGWATGCQGPTSFHPQASQFNQVTVAPAQGTNAPPAVVTSNRASEIAVGFIDPGEGVRPAAYGVPALENRPPQRPGCAADSIACGSQGATPGGYSPREVFRDDRKDFVPMLGRDAKGLLNWHDLALTGAALGGAIAIRQDLDDEVRDYVNEHPQRWNNGSKTLGYLGEVQYQVPVLLGVYGYSLYSADEELRGLAKALISAYTITGLSTLTVKAIADTDRPSPEWNDGNFGFPSFHTSSSFSIAAVVEEYHGLPTALPVYTLAALIGWSRIDEQDHDLSDVVFGAALGYVIGKSVAKQHKNRTSKMRLKPYKHPLEPAGGIAAEWRY